MLPTSQAVPDPELKLNRCIRASFGLALVLVSLFLPWAENLVNHDIILPDDAHGIARGLDAVVRLGYLTIPLWLTAVLTTWLVALSWLIRANLIRTNVLLVFFLNGTPLILLLSWFVKVSEHGAEIGVGVPVAMLGTFLALKAVPVEFEEVPAASSASTIETSATPEAQE
jgi:hypothetical protein